MCSTGEAPLMVTSDECRASNRQYLNSLAWCWESRCLNVSISSATFETAWRQAIPGALMTFQDALAIGRPTAKIDSSTTWLNTSMLPVESLYYPVYRTSQDFYELEKWHAIFGVILICIPWVLVLVGVLYNIADQKDIAMNYLPISSRVWFRKHVLFAALFREKCCVPVTFTSKIPVDYAPPRIVAVAVSIYNALNIVFCSVNFSTFEDSTYWSNKSGQLFSYIANRTGVLSFVNLPIVVIFASRNNIFQWLTGWSYATFQYFHKHAAIIATLEAVVHSLLYLVAKLKLLAYAVESVKPYWIWGVVATVTMSAILPLSILKIRQLSYELFLFLHYVLAVFVFVGCKFHISRRYTTEWGYNYWLYATYSVWGFDFLVRIIRVVRLIIIGVSTQATIELADAEAKVLRISYATKSLEIQRNVDNYYYLYFPQIFPFYTSHPFTVSSWTFNDGWERLTNLTGKLDFSGSELPTDLTKRKLVFNVKVCRGTTAKLYGRLQKNNFKPIRMFSLLEGPYGSYHSNTFEKYDVLLVITGGIGRTVALNFLNFYVQYSIRNPARGISKIVLFNSDRASSALEMFDQEIKGLTVLHPATMERVDVTLHNTSTNGRVDICRYIQEQVEKVRSQFNMGNVMVGVVSCGPPQFMDSTRRCIVDLQDEVANGVVVDFISSSFSW